MKILDRRTLLQSGFLLAWTNFSHPFRFGHQSYTANRLLLFPKPMSKSEYYKISQHWVDYDAISKLNDKLKESGQLISTNTVFLGKQALFQYKFKDKQSFHAWLTEIRKNHMSSNQFSQYGIKTIWAHHS